MLELSWPNTASRRVQGKCQIKRAPMFTETLRENAYGAYRKVVLRKGHRN